MTSTTGIGSRPSVSQPENAVGATAESVPHGAAKADGSFSPPLERILPNPGSQHVGTLHSAQALAQIAGADKGRDIAHRSASLPDTGAPAPFRDRARMPQLIATPPNVHDREWRLTPHADAATPANRSGVREALGFQIHSPKQCHGYLVDPLYLRDLPETEMTFSTVAGAGSQGGAEAGSPAASHATGQSGDSPRIEVGLSALDKLAAVCGHDAELVTGLTQFLGETKAIYGVRAAVLAPYMSPHGDGDILYFPEKEQRLSVSREGRYRFDVVDVSADHAARSSKALCLEIHASIAIDGYCGDGDDDLVPVSQDKSRLSVKTPLLFEKRLADGAVVVTRQASTLTMLIEPLPPVDPMGQRSVA